MGGRTIYISANTCTHIKHNTPRFFESLPSINKGREKAGRLQKPCKACLGSTQPQFSEFRAINS